jgi:hypothetical protein
LLQANKQGNAMDISGSSGVAQALQVKSMQMANSQQKQEGQAVMQLLEAAEAAPLVSSGSVGGNINTYA